MLNSGVLKTASDADRMKPVKCEHVAFLSGGCDTVTTHNENDRWLDGLGQVKQLLQSLLTFTTPAGGQAAHGELRLPHLAHGIISLYCSSKTWLNTARGWIMCCFMNILGFG